MLSRDPAEPRLKIRSKKFRRLTILLILLLPWCSTVCTANERLASSWQWLSDSHLEPLPNLGQSGPQVHQPQFQHDNKPTIVVYWMSWCGPCGQLMKRLDRDLQSGQLEGVQLVGVSLDEKIEDARKKVAETAVSFPQFHAGSGLAKRLALPKYPMTLVFDSKHSLIGAYSGLARERLELIKSRAQSALQAGEEGD